MSSNKDDQPRTGNGRTSKKVVGSAEIDYKRASGASDRVANGRAHGSGSKALKAQRAAADAARARKPVPVQAEQSQSSWFKRFFG